MKPEFEPRIEQPYPVQITDYRHMITVLLSNPPHKVPATRYETMVECRDRILRQVRSQFEDEYWPQVEEYFRYLVPTVKRDVSVMVIEWLDLFQRGQSYDTIEISNAGHGYTASFIRKSIKDLAVRLGIELRPSKTKKPKMHRNS